MQQRTLAPITKQDKFLIPVTHIQELQTIIALCFWASHSNIFFFSSSLKSSKILRISVLFQISKDRPGPIITMYSIFYSFLYFVASFLKV